MAKKKTSKKKPARKKKAVAVRIPKGVPRKKKNETYVQYHDRLSELAYAARQIGDTALATRIEAKAGALARKYKSVREKPRKRGSKGPGTYPWYECVDQQIAAGYSKEVANKICGSIRSRSRKKYPAYWGARGNPMSTLEALKKAGYVKIDDDDVKVTDKGLRMLQDNPTSAEGAALGALIGAWAGGPVGGGLGAYLGSRVIPPAARAAERRYGGGGGKYAKNPGGTLAYEKARLLDRLAKAGRLRAYAYKHTLMVRHRIPEALSQQAIDALQAEGLITVKEVYPGPGAIERWGSYEPEAYMAITKKGKAAAKKRPRSAASRRQVQKTARKKNPKRTINAYLKSL